MEFKVVKVVNVVKVGKVVNDVNDCRSPSGWRLSQSGSVTRDA